MTPVKPSTKRRRPAKAVVVYSRDAVLDYTQLGAGLGVSVEIARKMDLPFFMAGGRERFIWGQVLDILAKRAQKIA